MNDIRHVKRPEAPLQPEPPRQSPYEHEKPSLQALQPPAATQQEEALNAVLGQQRYQPQMPLSSKKRTKKKWIFSAIAAIIIGGALTMFGIYTWYQSQLSAVNPRNEQTERVVIKPGDGPKAIAATLHGKQLIKSTFGFEWYVRLHDTGGALQAGAYALSQSMPLAEIVDHLTGGKTDTITITFFPGGTLRDKTDVDESKKTDVTTILTRAGYSNDSIETALAKQYDHPLFASKPASADLEGYVYGETYEFLASATVEEVLTRTFDEMYRVIQENNLEQGFKSQGLSLYQGITLASIVQREVPTAADQKAVAGVFLNRLKEGISLGSDVTYQYAADKAGVPRDPGLDSPYNTRKYRGLPPGPIAAPSKSALQAVASPTKSDFLFFLSGDDDKTYFGKTQADHERNIANHCQIKCQIL